MTPTQEKAILGFIVLAAFVLRALFIGHESLWPDEALYLYISKNLTIDPLALKDVHGEWFYQNPPLFMYLLSFFMRTDILQPHVLAHFLTVAMDTGIVLISFFIGKKLFGTTVGLISAALLTVNPLHWCTSSRILMDIPLTFLVHPANAGVTIK
ncbi:MAG: glycosyltransferase family 39 protein [Deltaproteobacteria bacterium]|nr:glycosyltransferase family 39 protein [Deltaproteobacteria bacterium]